MVFWHEIPLLRFFLAFLTGVLIVCGTGATLPLSPWFYLLPGCIFSAYILYPKKLISYQTRWILGLSVYLLTALRRQWGMLKPGSYDLMKIPTSDGLTIFRKRLGSIDEALKE